MLGRARLLSDRRSDHLLHKHAQGSCSRDGDQNAQQAAERAPAMIARITSNGDTFLRFRLFVDG
jgi:hypothetical protein